MIFQKVTKEIIGAAMRVHSKLGNGFQEVIYQRSLFVELEKLNLNCAREVEMPVYYENVQVGTRRVDFLVNDNIAVELKAITKLEDVHLAQAINYCEAYNVPIGLLINFGAKSLQFRRLYNTNHPLISINSVKS